MKYEIFLIMNFNFLFIFFHFPLYSFHLCLHLYFQILMSGNISPSNDDDSNVVRKRGSFLKWFTTSMEWLAKAEEKMLSVVKCRLSKRYVRIFNNSAALWTVTATNGSNEKTPLVMVHGYGSGVGMWCLNFDELSQFRAVYSFDLLGFGRSSRMTFPKSADKVEDQFVESIEDWRKKEDIDKFHLLGHSFGGFVVGCYALKYPERVQSLIFADPWGFPVHEVDVDQNSLLRWSKSVQRVLLPFVPLSRDRHPTPWERAHWVDNFMKAFGPLSPFSIMRAAGPWGPKLLERFKENYKNLFSTVDDKQEFAIFHYIYHCNSFNPTGEKAFNRINRSLGYDRLPMIMRIIGLRPGMPVTFIYGAKSWIRSESGFQTKKKLPNNDVAVYVIDNAGHHVYAEKADEFNEIVNTRCHVCD